MINANDNAFVDEPFIPSTDKVSVGKVAFRGKETQAVSSFRLAA
jgi:hypothetical protein